MYDFQARALRIAAVVVIMLGFLIMALVIWAIEMGPDCRDMVDYCDAAL